MVKTRGYAAQSAIESLVPFDFNHREPGPKDVQVSIEFCGICHSDIHQVRNEWANSIYPMVPGHEIIGRVAAVGSQVTRYKPGDPVGVGVMVQSCRMCSNCLRNEESYCTKGMVATYNALDYAGNPTYGGYSDLIVTDEHFVYSISPKLDPAAAAPLLCAGITTYAPLRHWHVGSDTKVGIVGLGGLGHMALKFAHAFGARVVLFTTSANKIEDGERLGAKEVIVVKDVAALQKHAGTFDFILDCVAAEHNVDAYLKLLRLDGTLCLDGLPDKPVAISAFSVAVNRRSFAGSMIGGVVQTQEMLDFCAEKNIVADIELTSYDNLSEAYERVLKGDVKYRFVLDAKTLKQ